MVKVVSELGKALDRPGFAVFRPRPTTINIPFQKLVLSDPDAQGAIRIVVNALVKNGYHLEGGTKSEFYYNKLESKYRFKRFLRSAVWDLALFGNCFVELVGINPDGSGVVTELNLVSVPYTDIMADPRGNVIGYRVSHPTVGETFEFTPEQIVHLAWDRVSGQNWGLSPFQSLQGILHAKGVLQSYLDWMFETNQFRTHFNLETGTKEQAQDFISSIEASKKDPRKSLVTQGKINVGGLRDYDDLKELLGILHYYSNEINLVNQVSPIQAGVVEGTNRSSGDVQVRFNFMNNIQAKQEALEDELKYELLPRLEIPNSYYVRLNTADFKAELDLITTAEKLYNMGADMDKVNEWLIGRGVDIPTDLFPEREVEEERSIAQNSDSFPSRRGQDSMDRNKYQADGEASE
jgi:hypothetical protein